MNLFSFTILRHSKYFWNLQVGMNNLQKSRALIKSSLTIRENVKKIHVTLSYSNEFRKITLVPVENLRKLENANCKSSFHLKEFFRGFTISVLFSEKIRSLKLHRLQNKHTWSTCFALIKSSFYELNTICLKLFPFL